MSLLRIAKGLKATFKNARDYTLSQALLELEKYTDNYEVLNADYNRIYGDIDGKNLECNEEQFNELDKKTKEAIVSFLKDEPYCLMTASSYIHKKISWRFVLTNRKTSAEDNKKWVQMNIEAINLPAGITFDTAPYGKNQKIRMVGSNKDGENRPLRLVVGEPIDTLISYIPEDCELMELPKEKKKKKTKADESKMNPNLLRRIVMNINNDETTEWEQWYKVAQAIFNEGGDEELFLAWSSKSPKHNEREACLQWKSLRQGEGLTAGSLFYWSSISNLAEHERIILDCCSPDEYQHQKIVFERTHFKLMNPPCFVRQDRGQLQFIKDSDLNLLYQNLYCGDEVFIGKWKADRHIRTYDQIVFKPKQEVAKGDFNIFMDFACEAVQGDVSVMKDLMWLLSGENQEVFDYLENYFAHLIQKPYEKPGVAIVFYTSKQGAGKDTPLDFLGKILGNDYFYNTEDAENQVFGRFTSHLQKTLLLKMEEVEFETNKKNESALLSLITASRRSYEAKGREPITLDDYKRIVMTTNKANPVSVPESDRRFVLINSSEKRVGDRAYWDNVYAQLAKPETAQAYFYHLLHKDISAFNIRNRPTTDFYKDVKLSQRPYHATYFQNQLEMNWESDVLEWKARELFNDMSSKAKFAMSETKFGRDMKIYMTTMEAVHTRSGKVYRVETAKLREFLQQKGWWADL